MRTKLIAGNWKMNLTAVQGAALVEDIAKLIHDREDVDVAVCPPYLAIPKVHEAIRRLPIKLGAQDVFWLDSGAYTGKVSARQLYEYGCDFCIVGHSETRGRFGTLGVPESTLPFFAETDETINLKIKSLLYQGITPILCVGETEAEREAGTTEQVIRHQLTDALEGVEPEEMYTLVVAYEPVWAIGTGKVCDANEADRICRQIRSFVAMIADATVAESVRVLYGGSVKADNAKELLAMPDIDGALVGGASLEAEGFAKIVNSA